MAIFLAISGRESVRDRGQCLSDHVHHVVAPNYRRRVRSCGFGFRFRSIRIRHVSSGV